ncbi:MAG: DUF3185 family protein [Ectothiorhodospiraceae bacterium]|nr:DUF3185 family protein [Ectothiorhodospiraceae bacterium]MCH8505315.1 DUF3185 family protein [Ectothiorhodospiraceae bacterium]
MSPVRLLGLVVLVVGVVLLFFGINATDSIGESINETLTGTYSDETMFYLIGGIAAIVGGGVLFLMGKS